MVNAMIDYIKNQKALISYGGGVNSTAMIIHLFERGKFYPIVFADTGSEQPETYQFIKYFESFLEKKYGAFINVISPKTHKHLYAPRIIKAYANSLEEMCLKTGVVPFIAFRWCTADWKRDPIRKWGKEQDIYTHLIGIAVDEVKRAKKKKDGRYYNEYPLIGADIDRNECVEIIKRAGLIPPKKSGCFFCPYQRKREWKKLLEKHPELFKRAETMEENASLSAGRKVTMRADDYSLKEMKVNFKQENPLFDFRDYDDMGCFMCNT